MIGAVPSELESLFDNRFEERVTRFAADTGGSMYVRRDRKVGSSSLFLRLHARLFSR